MPNVDKKSRKRGRRGKADIQEKVSLASALFEERKDEIRAIIQFNMSDKSKVDDIFQDVFLAIVDKPIPPDVQNPKGYIYRIIINDIIDMARRTKSYQARIQRYAEFRRYSIINNDSENIVIQAEEREKMVELIERQLPSREAEAVIKRYDRDISIGDAAKRMNVKKRTFSRYLSLGLKKIRQFFREEGEKYDFR